MMFADMAEVHQALKPAVTLHTKIKAACRRPMTRTASRSEACRHHAGPHADRRTCLPKNHKVPFDVNRLLTKKEIGDVIDRSIATPARRTRCCSPTRSWRSASATRSGRHLVRQGRHGHPGQRRWTIVDETKAGADYEQQYRTA
jgi:hypothetical protein